MINPEKFAKLGNNQKIYKIASGLRAAEKSVKEGKIPDLSESFSYCALIRGGTERKIKEALAIIDPLLELGQHCSPKEYLQYLNFAYHDLLALLDKKEDQDSKFSFIRFDGNSEVHRFPWALILDNLRSPMNIGSIFRNADGFGLGEISLCGICPHPPDAKVARTALGAEETVPWKYFPNTVEAIDYWRSLDYRIYALEVAEPSISLHHFDNFEKSAFIVGNEEFGITEKTLALADAVVRIPLNGVKNSLNAANCCAVLAYEAQKYFMGNKNA